MPLGRILPQPSGTVPARPAYAARAAHGLAQLNRRERARGAGTSAHDGAARGGVARAPGGTTRLRCGDDLTGAREAAEESTAGPHPSMDGGAAELVGVDGSVGRHNEAWTQASGGTAVRRRPTRMAVEMVSAAGRHENAAARRTHWHVRWGRRRRWRARTHAVVSGLRRAWRGGRRRRCRSVAHETSWSGGSCGQCL
jgi:hypothetical protein